MANTNVDVDLSYDDKMFLNRDQQIRAKALEAAVLIEVSILAKHKYPLSEHQMGVMESKLLARATRYAAYIRAGS